MAHIVAGKSGKVILSFAHLLTPDDGEMGKGRYSGMFIIPKDDPCIPQIKKAIDEAVKLGIADGKFKKEATKSANFKNPLRDGSEKEGDIYENAYFINAKSGNKPVVIDRQRNKLTSEEDVYSGMYVAVVLSFFAFNNKGNVGIGAGLEQVLKMSDGTRLGGSSISIEEAFEDLLDPDAFEESEKVDEGNDDDSLF